MPPWTVIAKKLRQYGFKFYIRKGELPYVWNTLNRFVYSVSIIVILSLIQTVHAQEINNSSGKQPSPDPLSGLGDTANIIAVVGIGAGLGLYWYDIRRQNKELKKRAYTTISWELLDIKDTLTSGRFPIMKMEAPIKDKPGEKEKLQFTNAYLYDEAYSSLLNSGAFVQLHSNMQFLLAELYARIKVHNESLTYLYQLKDDIVYSDDNIEKNEARLNIARKRYFVFLIKLQDEIKDRLPKIRELIMEELVQIPEKPKHMVG